MRRLQASVCSACCLLNTIAPAVHQAGNRARVLSTASHLSATPLPLTATGPPPSAPLPAASHHATQIERRRRQAEMVKKGQEIRAQERQPTATGTMKRRFWKDVSVKTEPLESMTPTHHAVYLDSRPVKNPATQTALKIPLSRPHLATAIALEWDLLESAQQALRSHLIPLTSLAARAHALEVEDQDTIGSQGFAAPGSKGEGTRYDIVNTLLRYLDTDTLLCWAPPSGGPGTETWNQASMREGKSLREIQIQAAQPILAFLTQQVWPGVEIRPTLADGSILPRAQPAATRAVIKGWLAGLPAWELVGVERAVLAGKSLCVAVRLICEWSPRLSVMTGSHEKRDQIAQKFGIEEAAKACSLEVAFQTAQWGEVEDSHDVEKEDLRRQLGSVVLLVNGNATS